MIDLRSDTVTSPTAGMRKAMASAKVGDDVFSEDPTVNELQDEVADLFQKEAALFVPSGCMGNQIAIALHAGTGDEIIVESESHIFHYETTAPSIISRVQMHCVASERGAMTTESIAAAIRPDAYYFPKTKLICVENTHNRHGGTVLSLEYIAALDRFRRKRKLALHCDGARIWNACAASGEQPSAFAKHFDTLSVCLSKGLGAPVGSLILGTKEHIVQARRWRKILGGGMRQVGVLAAAGLYAVRNHRSGLMQDHANAASFAKRLANSDHVEVDNYPTQSNIVVFRPRTKVQPADFIASCQTAGLRISSGREGGWLRAVFHHQVSTMQTKKAGEIVVRNASSSALSTKAR